MAGFRFWQSCFPNPLGCCLPSSPSHFQNDDAQQQLLQTPSPTKASDLCSKSNHNIRVGIQGWSMTQAPIFLMHDDDQQELSPSKSDDDPFKNLGLLGKEKRRPKTAQVDPRSRAHCIDCLADAAEKLHCAPSTLHLAVNYLDRYLSRNQFDYLGRYLSGEDIEIEDLRFVGLTCLMIASKYDGVNDLFQLDAYLGLCKSAVSRGDLIRMEKGILSCLGYEMAAATAWSFLEQFVLAERGISLERVAMASYLAEVSLLSARMLPFLPSLVAASSLFLAQYVLEPSKRPWSAVYRRSDLRGCVLALRDCCYGSGSYYLPAITIKYSKKKYYYVALKSSPPSIPLHIFQD